MSLYEKKKLFYIDSTNRVSGTHSDFTYQLDLGRENYDTVAVLQANIPKSYYLVETGYNTFTLTEGILSATVTVPPGNYTRSSLRVVLATLLTTASPSHWTYTVSIPASTVEAETGKYTFLVTGNSGVQPSFTFSTFLYEQIGFDQNSVNTFAADTLVSTNVIKLQLEDSLFIHSDICSNGTDNVLQEIFAVDTQDYGNIIFVNPDVEAYSKKLTTKDNNIYRFYLSDEHDVDIDLNGLNIVFTLLVYKRENLATMLKQFIKLKLLEN